MQSENTPGETSETSDISDKKSAILSFSELNRLHEQAKNANPINP